MEKKERFAEDLKILREFMKNKKITYKTLSKEMNYSTYHVIKVFNGTEAPSEKFMTFVLRAIQQILQKDLKEFYKLIRGMPWIKFNME